MTEHLSIKDITVPSDPKTWWLGVGDSVWKVEVEGNLSCISNPEASSSAAEFAPFEQLIRKESPVTSTPLISPHQISQDIAMVKEEGVTEALAELRKTSIVTLAGKGGAYEWFKKRSKSNTISEDLDTTK